MQKKDPLKDSSYQHQIRRLLSRSYSYADLENEPATSCTEISSELEEDESSSAITLPDAPIFSSETFLPPRPNRVRFHSVEIKEYPIVPGDNPACHVGPPLSLSWEATNGMTISLDEFERLRRHERRERLEELMISSVDRSDLLKELGFSRRDIKSASSQASKVRKQRIETSEKEKKREAYREWKDKTFGRLSLRKTRQEFSASRIRTVQ